MRNQAFQNACEFGDFEVVKLLATLDSIDHHDGLITALANDHYDIAEFLMLEYNVNSIALDLYQLSELAIKFLLKNKHVEFYETGDFIANALSRNEIATIQALIQDDRFPPDDWWLDYARSREMQMLILADPRIIPGKTQPGWDWRVNRWLRSSCAGA